MDRTVLDPSIPPFKPMSMEASGSSYSPSSGHSDAETQSRDELRQLIIQSNSYFTREIVKLERQSAANAREIKALVKTFGSDMRTLQQMMHSMQNQIDEIKCNDWHKVSDFLGALQVNSDVSPNTGVKQLTNGDQRLQQASPEQTSDAEKYTAGTGEHTADVQNTKSNPRSMGTKPSESSEYINGSKDNKQPDLDGCIDSFSIEPVFFVPRAVREMVQCQGEIPAMNGESFTAELITSVLGGHQWSPGFFYNSQSIIHSKGYWVLEADWEPFLPSSPGKNGAKLTNFFNETVTQMNDQPGPEDYTNTPVFIRPKGSAEFLYFGQYSQKRYSDKLDYDRVTVTVPKHVRQHQADQLANVNRPEWITQALMQNFWPKPLYEGPLPCGNEDEAAKKRISQALWDHAEELVEWEQMARREASMLTSDTLMKAFERADADSEPGLRMHWEYLQCIAFDKKFYSLLVQHKHAQKPVKAVSEKSLESHPTKMWSKSLVVNDVSKGH